ncbi:MAG: type II secretion system F family protein, partial [Planctomycetota bacterium]
RVGERTGATPEAFRRLGEHYRRRLESTRRLRSLVAWPLIQLGIAAVVVGVLIAIGGVLTGLRGEPLDLLGFGLVGAGGLVAYTMLVGGTVAAAVLAWLWLRRTPEVAARVAAALSGVPVVGRCVELITLARIAWALRLLLNVDLDLRRVAPLAMRVSGNARYARLGEPIAAAIERGEPLSAAIEQTHTFPRDFIDTLRVAEETGRLSESMAALSTRYEQDAQRATQTLCGVAAGAIWLGVAGLIVWLIFRVAGFYTGVIYDAIDGL